VGKELSTQNLDYITLCKQKNKNDVIMRKKNLRYTKFCNLVLGSVKIGI